MGCASSVNVTGHKDSPVSNALEQALIEAIVSTKRRKSFKVKKSSFNNLMLQFPKLRAGFKRVRDCFKALQPDGTATITWARFKEKCSGIGLDGNSASVHQVFSIADVEDDLLVSATDLTLIFTVVYLLDANKKASIQYPEIKSALEIMEKAFTFFDSSSDGCIERKEMALAMKSGTRVFGKKASKSIADRLFDTLDWDGSGRITFKEFLVGMEKIIMEDFDDSDDDEDNDDDNELQELDDWEDEGDDKEEEEAAAGGGQQGGQHGGQEDDSVQPFKQ